MNLEILRASGWIIFETISGSKAYGTDVEGSDTDIRGIFIQPTDQILKGISIPQVGDDKNDTVFYEIGRFIELLSKGNPNILEILNSPQDCILYDSGELKEYLGTTNFLTSKLKHTFTGYAYSQIQKAKGLRKKINYDKNKVTRKGILDFCYVLGEKEEAIPFNSWRYSDKEPTIGLAKVNNFPDLYSMYALGPEGGFVSKGENESNDVQIRSIPKNALHLGYLRFDKNAYSTHCKDYREYRDWLENRNESRYRDNLKGEQGYDHKNMMHCLRLLYTAKDIAAGKGIIVRRPEREELLKVRNGEMPYEALLEKAELMVEEIQFAFDEANLPHHVVSREIQDILFNIRMKHFKDGFRYSKSY